MEQRCHVEVSDLAQSVAVLVAEHIAHRLALLIQSRKEAVQFPHRSVLLVVHDIRWRSVRVEVVIPKVVTLVGNLQDRLALLHVRLADIIELSFGKVEQAAITASIDGYYLVIGITGKFHAA